MAPGHRSIASFAVAWLLVLLSSAPVAAAAAPKPKVQQIAVSSAALPITGGSTTVTATVSGALSCQITSSRPVPGLPRTTSCSSGSIAETFRIPGNVGKAALRYQITLTASGSGSSKASAKAAVTVANSGVTRQLMLQKSKVCVLNRNAKVACTRTDPRAALSMGPRSGLGAQARRPSAVLKLTNLEGLSGVVEVAGGVASSCALLADTTVSCWGNDNSVGQLGYGYAWGTSEFEPPAPVWDLEGVKHIAGDGVTFCALLEDSSVSCWGSNRTGQLGSGSLEGPETCWVSLIYPTACSTRPQAVPGLTDVASIEVGGGASNESRVCAVLISGDVKCWGYAGFSLAGASSAPGSASACESTICTLAPTQVVGLSSVKQVVLGYRANCALKLNGSVWCWGNGATGQLGDGDLVGPVDCSIGSYAASCADAPQVVPGLSGVEQLTGKSGAFCARSTAGTVSCWGSNAFGQAGIETANEDPNCSDNVQRGSCLNPRMAGPESCGVLDGCSVVPRAVPGLSGVVDLESDSFGYSCALSTTGQISCWGRNGGWLASPVGYFNVFSPNPVAVAQTTS